MGTKSFTVLNAILIVFFLIPFTLICCGGVGGGGSDDGGDVPLTHGEMLNALGVDTDIGVRKDPVGEPVADDYNPTLRGITQLAKRSEIFLAGTLGQDESDGWTPGDEYNVALDWPDGANDFVPDNLGGDQSWLKMPKALASGDLDGDGIDEIFIAYRRTSDDKVNYDWDLAYRVIKRKAGVYEIIAEGVVASYLNDDITEYPDDSGHWWMNNFNVTCGDVDGNSRQETLIAFNGSVFLMGDSSQGYGIRETIDYKTPDSNILLKISAGDLTNDGMYEFVVVENTLLEGDQLKGSARYHIYTGPDLEELDEGIIAVTKDSKTVVLHASNCAVGDLDADGLNEILFIGAPENDDTYYMMILEPTWNGNDFEFSFKPDFEFLKSRNPQLITPICAIADFDGDGRKEFIGHEWMYENLSETEGSFQKKEIGTDDYHSIYLPPLSPLGSVWDCSLAVGDVDGDMKADIVYISDGFFELYCLGFNDANEWVRKGSGDIEDPGVYYPYVTMGDYDGDSIVVEFLESETLFSDPHPIAVLAANPFWSGVDMDGQTSVGTTTGSEVEKEKSVGFSVGFSVGYESEGPLNLWSASIKTSFESSFDLTAIESLSIEESYTYSTVNEDKVIFTAVPYDVYYYKVIQAPEPDMLDEVVTINLPRKPITLPVERTFYNANNGELLDIDSSVLTHSIGNPLSYPTSNMADQLIASGGEEGGIKSSKMLTVGQGSGSSYIIMSVENTTGTSTAFDFSVKIEAEVGAGGFTAGRSRGFHYGESYSITTSEGTQYRGDVGNMPAEDWDPAMAFSWGLFSYKEILGDEKFIVVQYYTENLNTN